MAYLAIFRLTRWAGARGRARQGGLVISHPRPWGRVEVFMDLSHFELLESRISALLDRLAGLTRDKEELEKKLAATQNDLEAAESLIQSLEEERQVVRGRVEAMLAKLE